MRAGPSRPPAAWYFIAATTDSKFRAFDSRTGSELWVTKLDATGTTVPMTYLGSDGKQYVVIAAGGTQPLRDDRQHCRQKLRLSHRFRIIGEARERVRCSDGSFSKFAFRTGSNWSPAEPPKRSRHLRCIFARGKGKSNRRRDMYKMPRVDRLFDH